MTVILYFSLFILLQWLFPWWTLAILVASYAYIRVDRRSFLVTGIESLSVPIIVHFATILIADSYAQYRISHRLSELFQMGPYSPYFLTISVTLLVSLLSFFAGATLRRALN